MDHKFYTVTQAADILNLSKLTVWRKVRSGEIPSTYLGKRPLIPEKYFQQLRDKALNKVQANH